MKRPSLSIVIAAALALACLVTVLDMLAGSLVMGAHLDAAVTGPPLLLVDLLGVVGYFVVILAVSLVFRGVAHSLPLLRETADPEILGLAVPVAAFGLLLIGLRVGQDWRPGFVGGSWVTASLVVAVAFIVVLVSVVHRAAARAPGWLVVTSLLFVIVMWSALGSAEAVRLPLGSRRAHVVRLALAMGWAFAFVLISVLQKRGLARPRGRPYARALAAGIAFTAVPLLFAAVRAAPRGTQASADAPNIVLITFDAMRADRLSLYGGPVPAPQFEALARDGVVFERAYSQSPATMASVPSMFSSLYPSELPSGGSKTSFAIPKTSQVLAEALQERGYATYAVVANYALCQATGVLRGFSKQVLLYHRAQQCNVFSLVLPAAGAVVQSVVRRPQHECLPDTSQTVLRYSREFVGRPSRRPFFLWLHFMDPHDPYAPPARYRSGLVHHKGRWPIIAGLEPSLDTPTVQRVLSGHLLLTAEDRGYIEDLYNAEIAYADDLLGEVRSIVQENSPSREVVWCVTADHGEEFWDHDKWGHNHSLYGELLHVPLLIAAPETPRGVRVANPVGLIDVVPTLWSLSGLPPAQEHRGTNLRPLMAGEARDSSRPVFSDKNGEYEPLEAVVVGDMKLIRHLDGRIVGLFDLVNDRLEQRNLAQQQPEVVNRLAHVLDRWRSGLAPIGPPVSAEEQREQMERLRSLGYLQ